MTSAYQTTSSAAAAPALAMRAWTSAFDAPHGPVHLNLSLREPLATPSEPAPPTSLRFHRGEIQMPPEDLADLADRLSGRKVTHRCRRPTTTRVCRCNGHAGRRSRNPGHCRRAVPVPLAVHDYQRRSPCVRLVSSIRSRRTSSCESDRSQRPDPSGRGWVEPTRNSSPSTMPVGVIRLEPCRGLPSRSGDHVRRSCRTTRSEPRRLDAGVGRGRSTGGRSRSARPGRRTLSQRTGNRSIGVGGCPVRFHSSTQGPPCRSGTSTPSPANHAATLRSCRIAAPTASTACFLPQPAHRRPIVDTLWCSRATSLRCTTQRRSTRSLDSISRSRSSS